MNAKSIIYVYGFGPTKKTALKFLSSVILKAGGGESSAI